MPAMYTIDVSASIGYQSDEAEGRARRETEDLGDLVFGQLPVSARGYVVSRHAERQDSVVRPVPDADFKPSDGYAEQIVADDPRFAEATVKFWWPAIMGGEIVEPPEDEGDADFEGKLVASIAQNAEVVRLGRGFRRGFSGRPPYSLKDLLVEIVLSKWFQAESLETPDAARAASLELAGANRLLTPEELSRKTLALTGFQWGRNRAGTQPWRAPIDQNRGALTDLESGYGLLYGGIDSDGVIDRAGDLTSVMAGVAQSHALQTSCPVVMKELYLVPDNERRLFEGVDFRESPSSELNGTFDIKSASAEEKEVLSLAGRLTDGTKEVRLTYVNDFYDDELGDRNINVDNLRLLTAQGEVVSTFEVEDVGRIEQYCEGGDDAFWMAVNCTVAISLDVPAEGDYVMEIVVWGDQAGDEYPRLVVSVDSDGPTPGARAKIENALAGLYEKLHGIEVTANSSEVARAYDLFMEVWEHRRIAKNTDFFGWDEGIECEWGSDQYYLDGIVEDAFVYREDWGDEYGARYGWDWNRINEHFETIDWSDPHGLPRPGRSFWLIS